MFSKIFSSRGWFRNFWAVRGQAECARARTCCFHPLPVSNTCRCMLPPRVKTPEEAQAARGRDLFIAACCGLLGLKKRIQTSVCRGREARTPFLSAVETPAKGGSPLYCQNRLCFASFQHHHLGKQEGSSTRPLRGGLAAAPGLAGQGSGTWKGVCAPRPRTPPSTPWAAAFH